MEALSIKPAGAVPEAAESVNHDWVLLADQLSVPPPVLLMFTICEFGLLPPAKPLKLAALEDKPRIGVDGGCCEAGPKNRPLATAFAPASRVIRTVTCPARVQTRYWPFTNELIVRVSRTVPATASSTSTRWLR